MDKLEEKNYRRNVFLRISAKLNDEISKLEEEKEILSKICKQKNDDEEK
ncbi:MAG: hypothetical protein L6V78_04845 [Clostridium sp.]|nr:MAG: hypothetical protein L6V78_04845 [Clostridium sp.]